MYCTNCGALCKDDMKYCPSCGKKLSGIISTPAPVKKSPPSPPSSSSSQQFKDSKVNDIQRDKQKDLSVLKKVAKTICLVIAIPMVLLQAISTGGKFFHIQRLINWYKND